jgi:hypothetical protein
VLAISFAARHGANHSASQPATGNTERSFNSSLTRDSCDDFYRRNRKPRGASARPGARGVLGYKKFRKFWKKEMVRKTNSRQWRGLEKQDRAISPQEERFEFDCAQSQTHSSQEERERERERERVVVRPDQNRTKQNELGTIQSSTSQARGEEALLTRIRGNESEPGWICTPVGAGRGERQRAAPARCLSLGAARRGGSARARRPRGAGGSFVRDERLAARPPARPRGRTARRE